MAILSGRVDSAHPPATATPMAITIQAGKMSPAEIAKSAPSASGTIMPSARCTTVLVGGNAKNASTMANIRWIERASVSLKTPKPSANGNGDANQSWNMDQISANPAMSFPTAPPADRPPVSEAAINSSSSACVGLVFSPVSALTSAIFMPPGI